MNGKKFDSFDQYFDKWKKNLINYGLQKNLLNKELENFINNLGTFNYEIYKSLFSARVFYINKRDNYNQRIRKLEEKKNEYKEFLEYFKREITHLTESKIMEELSASIQMIKLSIEESEEKIYVIGKKLEEEPLDIAQENTLIEKIQNLEKDKKAKLSDLKRLNQNLNEEVKNDLFYRTLRSIEILELNLNEINDNLIKWSKKRIKTHKKMLNLYRKSRKFEIIKKQMEHELFSSRQSSNRYFQLFHDLNEQTKQLIIQEQIAIIKSKELHPKELPPKEIQTPHIKEVIKRKKVQKKFMKKRLAIALDKKKAGKKLDFYELKLILDHSKK